MHPIIENNREAIAELCRVYGVSRLEVFGSALRQDFNVETSDVDVAVEFEAIPQIDSVRQYFDFKTSLEELLKRSVDVVELGAMQNTRLKRIIERTKVPVYAAS